jgi:exopolysaccharide biosynthesis polyprenyl glycosylphosphotransferase
MPAITTSTVAAHGRRSAWAEVHVQSPSGVEVTTKPSRAPNAGWRAGSGEDLYDLVGGKTRRIIDYRRRGTSTRRRGWLIRRALVLADVVGLVLAFLVAELLFSPRAHGDPVHPWLEVVVFGLTLPIWVVMGRVYGLYKHDEERNDHTTVDDLIGIFHFVTVGAWVFFMASSLTHLTALNLHKLLTFWVLAIVLVVAGRVVARFLCRRRLAYIQNAIIVGAGDIGQRVAQKFIQHPEYGVNVVGFVDDAPKDPHEGLEELPILGPPDSLRQIVQGLDVDRVIVAFSNASQEETVDVVRSLSDFYVQVDIVPRLFDVVSPTTTIHTVEGIPLIGLPRFHLSRSSRMLKRATDVSVSAALLVLASPLLALIAIRIKLDSRGPVLFRQVRIGVGDRTFTMLKFRTMSEDADEHKHEVAHLNRHARHGRDARMFKIPDDPRVTRFGRKLRRYALDELPQLANVLRGDMSLVGPRPLIHDEDRYVLGWGRRRLELKPGMTGLWQVLGRSAISFDEMVRLDYLYVTTWSLWNDFRLLGRTIPLVLNGRGEPADLLATYAPEHDLAANAASEREGVAP